MWKTFGVGDRFGFSIVGGHPHCQLPQSQRPEVEAFVDKFLLGETDADTSVTKHPFENVEYIHWYDGWLTGTSTFPEPDSADVESVFYEVELAEFGANWNLLADERASNSEYLTIESGLNSTNAAPRGDDGTIQIPFSVTMDAKYYVFARVNCPTADDDSFWIKVDDGEFVTANGLRTVGWDWVELMSTQLTPGDHTLTIAYREDGALLDKIGITTYVFGPPDVGEDAVNLSDE